MTDMVKVLKEMGLYNSDGRQKSLTRLSERLRELGFFPLPITSHDMDCFWVRIQGARNEDLSVTHEALEDALAMPYYMETLKAAARYENS